jgi:hypothetical protein
MIVSKKHLFVLIQAKYSDTMDIYYNMLKWAWKNKFGSEVVAFLPMVSLPVSLL